MVGSGPFGVQILIDEKPVVEYTKEANVFVEAVSEKPYIIRVSNKSGDTVGCSIIIDSLFIGGWIYCPPNTNYDITGWFFDNVTKSKEFLFSNPITTTQPDEPSVKLEELGHIQVEFFPVDYGAEAGYVPPHSHAEFKRVFVGKQKPPQIGLTTVQGKDRAVVERFKGFWTQKRSKPDQTFHLYYKTADELVQSRIAKESDFNKN